MDSSGSHGIGNGKKLTIEAVLDAGYNGNLLLPRQVITELDLETVGVRQAMLRLLAGTRIVIEVIDGGKVSVERLAPSPSPP